MTCTVEGCDRPGSPLCPMHRKRQQRGADLHAPEQERLSPWERLIAACNSVADADSDDDQAYDRATGNLRTANVNWTIALLERGEVNKHLLEAVLHAARAALGRARWAGSSPQDRAQAMRVVALRRWTMRHASSTHPAAEPVLGPRQAAGHERRRSEQGQAGKARRAPVEAGAERQPGRAAEDGGGRAGAAAEPHDDGGGAPAGPGVLGQRGGGVQGGGSAAGPGRGAANRRRGRQARGDR